MNIIHILLRKAKANMHNDVLYFHLGKRHCIWGGQFHENIISGVVKK